jgi:hypothetical protein
VPDPFRVALVAAMLQILDPAPSMVTFAKFLPMVPTTSESLSPLPRGGLGMPAWGGGREGGELALASERAQQSRHRGDDLRPIPAHLRGGRPGILEPLSRISRAARLGSAGPSIDGTQRC